MARPARKDYLKTECAVIGAGLAGCTVALELAEAGHRVELFSKGKLGVDGNSYLIAGGLAAVPTKESPKRKGDSLALHVRETLGAGKGLNDEAVVEYCVRHFYHDVIEWLVERGVTFDRSRNGVAYDLHREGGHSHGRIFHHRDTTGMAIMDALARKVARHPRIRVHSDFVAVDLVTKNKLRPSGQHDICLGAYLYDAAADRVVAVEARGVFLATGGLGKVFLYTTNADAATGDGFAMCYRAGLPLANMEFVQFHPSVFYDAAAALEGDRRFLLTEALRGAGAILKLHANDREDFVKRYDPHGSNATRDVVTRAQDIEMRRQGLKHLWLDCTSIGKRRLLHDFRGTYRYCKQRGFDITRDPIPIIYAAHYSNGGVLVGRHSETGLEGCYVLGETSYTGLHGATRLASNSAPECVLYGRLAAKHFSENLDGPSQPIPAWRVGEAKSLRDHTTVSYYWETIRRTMSALCGVARNEERLEAAREVLSSIKQNIHDFYWNYRVTRDFLEVRNIADVAGAIIESALARRETRACHFREDYPRRDDAHYRRLTIVRKNRPASLQDIELVEMESLQ